MRLSSLFGLCPAVPLSPSSVLQLRVSSLMMIDARSNHKCKELPEQEVVGGGERVPSKSSLKSPILHRIVENVESSSIISSDCKNGDSTANKQRPKISRAGMASILKHMSWSDQKLNQDSSTLIKRKFSNFERNRVGISTAEMSCSSKQPNLSVQKPLGLCDQKCNQDSSPQTKSNFSTLDRIDMRVSASEMSNSSKQHETGIGKHTRLSHHKHNQVFSPVSEGKLSKLDGNQVGLPATVILSTSKEPEKFSPAGCNCSGQWPSHSDGLTSHLKRKAGRGTVQHDHSPDRISVNVNELQECSTVAENNNLLQMTYSMGELDEYALPNSFWKNKKAQDKRSKCGPSGPKCAAAKGHQSSKYPEGSPTSEPFDICLPENERLLKLKDLTNTEKDRIDVNQSISGPRQRVLRPGMIWLRRYITHEEQVFIVRRCRELGLGSGGFYQPGYNDGAKLRLQMMCLGLDWDPQTRQYGERRRADDSSPPDIPKEFSVLVHRAIEDSHALIERECHISNVEDILPSMSPDICIVNFYKTSGRLGLHQDRDESVKSISRGLPVVSFSVGDSAEFLYGDRRDIDKAEKVVLDSGDVLIFGGKSRHIFHGVQSIVPDSAPEALVRGTGLRPGRLNLTFRQY